MPTTYATTVDPEWIDYNGHMNSGYFNIVVDRAVTDLLEKLGAMPYMARTSGTFYTVETHLIYGRELKAGDRLRVVTQVLGCDRKRLHLFSTIYHDGSGEAAATGESMLLHVVQDEGRVRPMPDDFYAGVAALAREDAALPRPENVGRAISLPRPD